MRLVDIKTRKSPSMCYLSVPQPMVIYHSQNEFNSYISRCRVERTNFNVILDFGGWHNFINKNNINLNYNPNERYVDVRKYNAWIRTVDEFVPDSANIYGDINYKLDEDNQKIPTTGCYIQLYYITPTPVRHIIYTSSGVHTIGIVKWNMTAAVRDSFHQESAARTNKGEQYQAKLNKLLVRKRPTVPHIRAVQAMLNPLSEVYLDVDRVMNMNFHQYKKDDRDKIIKSPAFKEALMTVLQTLFPKLKQQIRQDIPPEAVTDFMKKMMENVLGKETSKEQMEVLAKIIELGYTEDLGANYINAELGDKTLGSGFEHDKYLEDGNTDASKKLEPANGELTDEEKAIKEDLNGVEGYVEQPTVNDSADIFVLKEEEKDKENG